MEAILAAKQAGKIRFIGFTGHKNPRIHLYTLETEAKNGFNFDTVQMPRNRIGETGIAEKSPELYLRKVSPL